ncbi:hypothetical protein V8E54_007769 [Elaphomyces granulatus]
MCGLCLATNNTDCHYANGPYYPSGPRRPAGPPGRNICRGASSAYRRSWSLIPFSLPLSLPPPPTSSSSSPPPRRPPPPHRPRPASVLCPGRPGFPHGSRPVSPGPENNRGIKTTAPASPPPSEVPQMISDPFLLLYYEYFHGAHPILLPANTLGSVLFYQILSYLRAVIRYIGAHYYRDPSARISCREVAHAILSDDTPRNGFKVQGMLLLAIITFADGDESRARQLLQAAIRLALELGMNRAAFTVEHAMGSSLLEESWCRTYWELYVVNPMLAALRGPGAFSLYLVPSDLTLPCDETTYQAVGLHEGYLSVKSNMTGRNHNGRHHPVVDIFMSPQQIPSGRRLGDLQDDGSFCWQENEFSSFAYRIEAMRLLGTVLDLLGTVLDLPPSSRLENELDVETVDAGLVAWFRRLPASKHESMWDDDAFDEMLFQAQMIIHTGMICLYRPRASLTAPPAYHSRNAFPQWQGRPQQTAFPHGLDSRSKKLVRAADALSSLVSALGMSVVVHTAAHAFATGGTEREESIKVRIQLAFGVLNRLADSWPLANPVKQQLLKWYQQASQGFR